ncbi:DUF4442 domain-containing protein [Mucilaginibacter sp. 21P]|uniref:DUF4442 domain-containing protein n=1 Tax=Mucilaginibacter sp. 21P TaxID=2778902 RepID=UPI002104416F|nr:DUF4442 domain-containing protein [Mucilaginibacter sp. 21P]
MRIYPPLLFQRVWVKRFYKDFRGVEVKVFKSILNKNYNGTIFGGTIFAAADPFLPVLFDRVLQSSERKLRIWSKSSQINFLKPANTTLHFSVTLTDEYINDAIQQLQLCGKYEKSFIVEILNSKNEICASLSNEVYIRDLNFKTLDQ